MNWSGHPNFDAGHGVVLNAGGDHELDAAIMDGRLRPAGAVASARAIRNPVHAARRVNGSYLAYATQKLPVCVAAPLRSFEWYAVDG